MSIYELSEEELSELRQAMYYGCDEYEWLSDDEKAKVDSVDFWDIPFEILVSAFGHYSFVPEDFSCNLEK